MSNPEHIWLYQGLNKLVNEEAARKAVRKNAKRPALVHARTRDKRTEHVPAQVERLPPGWLARTLSATLDEYPGGLASIHPELRLALIHKLSAP